MCVQVPLAGATGYVARFASGTAHGVCLLRTADCDGDIALWKAILRFSEIHSASNHARHLFSFIRFSFLRVHPWLSVVIRGSRMGDRRPRPVRSAQ
jgi:hypothetical protein